MNAGQIERLCHLYATISEKFDAINTLKPETDTQFEPKVQYDLIQHHLMEVSSKYMSEALVSLSPEQKDVLLIQQTNIILGLTDLVVDLIVENEENFDSWQSDKKYFQEQIKELKGK